MGVYLPVWEITDSDAAPVSVLLAQGWEPYAVVFGKMFFKRETGKQVRISDE